MAADDFVPRPDQLLDLAHLIKHERHMLLSDPGTGKTLPAALYTFWNWDRRRKKTVWLQPLAIIKKNRDEILRFTNFEERDVVIVQGTPDQRQGLYRRGALVYLMGADMFGREWEDLLRHNPEIDLVIGDEWHMMFSSHTSQRTQSLYRAMQRITRLCPMTGTLVRGRLNSAYPAIKLIEPRYYPSYEAFMNFHAVLDDYGKPIHWMNIDKLREILLRHACRHSFEEVYGKVEVVFQTQKVDMNDEQAAAYTEFAEKAVLELDDAFLDGTVPGVNLIRARQILSSPELFGLCKGETTARDELLTVHLEDHKQSGDPLIIGSASKPEQERVKRLCKKLGLRAEVMNGDTPPHHRGLMDEAFRRGEIDVMIISPLVGSIGFNWPHVDHCIFLHLDYYHDTFEQLWRRMTRGKRTRPALVHTIVYRDTVEEAVVGVLMKKQNLSHEVDNTKEVVDLHRGGIKKQANTQPPPGHGLRPLRARR